MRGVLQRVFAGAGRVPSPPDYGLREFRRLSGLRPVGQAPRTRTRQRCKPFFEPARGAAGDRCDQLFQGRRFTAVAGSEWSLAQRLASDALSAGMALSQRSPEGVRSGSIIAAEVGVSDLRFRC